MLCVEKNYADRVEELHECAYTHRIAERNLYYDMLQICLNRIWTTNKKEFVSIEIVQFEITTSAYLEAMAKQIVVYSSQNNSLF